MASPDTAERLAPLIRSLLAPNPSAFTYEGTRTYIVGEGDVAVIDPGPDLAAHRSAILDAVRGETVTAILCTHTHRDHSPGARPLATATGAPIVGCAPLPAVADESDADENFDRAYAPDLVLADGERVAGKDWTLEAVATPGHTSNHLCFAFLEANALFSGDHVMGWSTSIVSPPDGDMGAYVASLDKLLGRSETIYHPGHGPSIDRPRERVHALIAHRRARETQIVARLRAGEGDPGAMVAAIYADVDPRLHPAAERSVIAHLIDLARRGIAACEDGCWTLAA